MKSSNRNVVDQTLAAKVQHYNRLRDDELTLTLKEIGERLGIQLSKQDKSFIEALKEHNLV